MVPGGKNPTADSKARPASSTSWGATSWVRSTRWTSRQMPRITPFITPTNGSRRPKSVVSVTIGEGTGGRGPSRPLRSAIPVHDEVSDEGERVPVLGGREGRQRVLRRLRVRVGPRQRIVDALVLDHEAPDLLDLHRIERVTLEQRLDPLALRRLEAVESGDERQCPLPFLEVGAHGLSETLLVGDEFERVVADLKRDADVEP